MSTIKPREGVGERGRDRPPLQPWEETSPADGWLCTPSLQNCDTVKCLRF